MIDIFWPTASHKTPNKSVLVILRAIDPNLSITAFIDTSGCFASQGT
jgi:hypothetical protein